MSYETQLLIMVLFAVILKIVEAVVSENIEIENLKKSIAEINEKHEAQKRQEQLIREEYERQTRMK